MSIPPAALPENADLAFAGERLWAPAQLTERQARQLLAAANACGRPNADVLRRRLAVIDGAPAESWQIDFPSHFTAQEAALYEQPFARLAGNWRNPHAKAELRRALARCSRYLAMPAHAEEPDWLWVEEELLPDASLVVVTRDDDFTQGVLASQVFAAWYAGHRQAMPADQIVASFPFPWPPALLLSQLNRAQQELRSDITRAARSGDRGRLDSAVLAAYGWPAELEDHEIVSRLSDLNRQRAVSTPTS